LLAVFVLNFNDLARVTNYRTHTLGGGPILLRRMRDPRFNPPLESGSRIHRDIAQPKLKPLHLGLAKGLVRCVVGPVGGVWWVSNDCKLPQFRDVFGRGTARLHGAAQALVVLSKGGDTGGEDCPPAYEEVRNVLLALEPFCWSASCRVWPKLPPLRSFSRLYHID
jgi:hypothetical protein